MLQVSRNPFRSSRMESNYHCSPCFIPMIWFFNQYHHFKKAYKFALNYPFLKEEHDVPRFFSLSALFVRSTLDSFFSDDIPLTLLTLLTTFLECWFNEPCIPFDTTFFLRRVPLFELCFVLLLWAVSEIFELI